MKGDWYMTYQSLFLLRWTFELYFRNSITKILNYGII